MATEFGRGQCSSCGTKNTFDLKEITSARGLRCIACGGRVVQDENQQHSLSRKKSTFFSGKAKKPRFNS